MPIKNSGTRYGIISKTFHWMMALIIFTLFGIGLYMTDLPDTPDKFQLIFWHKSFGLLILFCVFLRLAWRFITPPPPLPGDMKGWQKFGAHASHYGLYMLMFAVPMLGWLMSSYAGFPPSFFKLFQMPDLVSPDKLRSKEFLEWHGTAAWALVILAVIHALAGLWHHFIRKDNVLKGMIPFGKVAILLILVPSVAHAAVPTWAITPAKSSITFIATNNGAEVKGNFTAFDGDLAFDPAQLKKSRITAAVDVTSVSSDSSNVADTLKTETWFDVSKYTTATFESEDFREGKDGGYEAHGTFTLRGISKPLVITFTVPEKDATHMRIEGKAHVSRTEYGVGQGEWAGTSVVADGVDIVISLTANAAK